jgi:DNA-binding transcriptional MerR regulator
MKIYSTSHVAEMFGLTVQTVCAWAGKAGLQKLGKQYIFTDADLDRFKTRKGQHMKNTSVELSDN